MAASAIGLSGCTVCREPITGQVISALAHKMHADCFACAQCLNPFDGAKFFEKENRLYCESDYQALFGARCARCGETITTKSVTALDMKWHPEHFTCDECGKSLGGTSFVKRLGRPYCKECLELIKQRELERTKHMCDRCKKPIADPNEMLIIKKQKFHAFHFSCTACKKDLTPDCEELDGKLYCRPCHSSALSATCAVCRRPIDGRSINALGKMYHPEHFVCTKCEKPFAGGHYYEVDGDPYCEVHFNEQKGNDCARCGEPASGRVVAVNGRSFCEKHFTCIGCEVDLSAAMKGKFFDWDTKAMCKDCYNKLPSKLQAKLSRYADLERKFTTSLAK